MVDNPFYTRFTTLPRGSFFLFGPRGVGKRTWARTKLARAYHFDFLNEALYQSLLFDPSLFGAELRGLSKGRWL